MHAITDNLIKIFAIKEIQHFFHKKISFKVKNDATALK